MPFLSNIGTTELLIIAVVILVLFGGKKLSDLARGLGQSSKEIKKVKKEFKDALMEEKEGGA
ncbi:twin-arginine translocase TatA/TatE family subunit [Candidatus Microgenomates bacterium]|nr:twin-arginine translocase TatA/TatE family subunit [Candidatus Microgenomates bacterium]